MSQMVVKGRQGFGENIQVLPPELGFMPTLIFFF